ncbi:allergin-1 isoform 3-T3 [Thomomys bottae]
MRSLSSSFFFFSLSVQKAMLDDENLSRKDEMSLPNLTSNASIVRIGQNVFLFCSIKNPLLRVNYSLFFYKKQMCKKKGKGEPVVFNLKISKANESGPYKCKAQTVNISKYSQEFNFTVVGKATTVKGPTDSGALSLDSDLYENTYNLQPRSESTQEIHYTTPVFQEMSTWKKEDYHISKTRSVYCELNFSNVKN